MPNATCAECGAIADDHDEFHIHQRFPAGRSARARWSARAAGGVERKIHFFAIDLPHSDGCFVQAYPGPPRGIRYPASPDRGPHGQTRQTVLRLLEVFRPEDVLPFAGPRWSSEVRSHNGPIRPCVLPRDMASR